MSDAKVNALVKVRDGFRMVADAVDEYLETLSPPGVKDEKPGKNAEITMSKIQWQPADGSKGPYEFADDVNNAEFQTLSKILAEYKGKMRIGPYFVWQFTNSNAIGRKRSQ
jgi:hypothetical protein